MNQPTNLEILLLFRIRPRSPSFSRCEHPCHESDHGEVDEALGGGDGFFIVSGKPATAREPREGAFHDPADRLHFESLLIVATRRDAHAPLAVYIRAPISTVRHASRRE